MTISAPEQSLKAVLFDHDGTLVDSEDAHWQIWNTVLAPYGCRISLERYQLYYAGFPTRANVAQAMQDFDLKVDADRLIAQKTEATDAFQAQQAFALMPHVHDILDWCKHQGLRMAVVTGANRGSLQATLQAYHLSSYFETSVAFEDVAHSKPAPDSYLQALSNLGLQAHECVALEDTHTGVCSAVAAGVAVIAIRNAWTYNQDFSQANYICENLQEAQQHLARMMQPCALKA